MRIARISADGAVLDTSWATLSNGVIEEDYSPSGMHIDTVGVFGANRICKDLFVVTGYLPDNAASYLWRIAADSPTRQTTRLYAFYPSYYVEGVLTCPNDSGKYSAQWAGKILVGAPGKDDGVIYAVSADGSLQETTLGIHAYDLHIIPQSQDLYWVKLLSRDVGQSTLYKVQRGFFDNITDDVLLVQSGEIWWAETGNLFLVHWNGSAFVSMGIVDDNETRQLEHAVFAPLSLPTNP